MSDTRTNITKGYKVFNPDWTCRGFHYEIGNEYTHDGDIELCSAGFHFCENAADCFIYYSFNSSNKVSEVEAFGKVETDGKISATDKIRIVREIPWQELLTIVNAGRSCTGIRNAGNNNSGDYNTGNWNTGGGNTGSWNTRNCNTGNCNTGDRNTGSWNTGDCNAGDRNTGSENTGNWNTGCWNTGDWNTGFFNTDEPFVRCFNKPTEMRMREFRNLAGVQVLERHYVNNWWINSAEMTDGEKALHPAYKTTGGYLKSIPYKDACRLMWEKLSNSEKNAVMAIPNFDAEIFFEITGIDVTEDKNG